jgi:dihydrofolate synthase / folylpolyglutamate synthase
VQPSLMVRHEDDRTIVTYEDALNYLFADARFDGRGQKYANPERSQERMREILARLGNPQQAFKSLHIAGTKGKGSTSAYCESMLRHLGYRTGLFTSPHLHTFRERIRIDGQLMGRQALADLVDRLRPHFEAIPDLTIFDKITTLAFQHFADVGVEWAVVEVGLGGRLDSTNVLLPEVCGITRISKDHTQVLGEKIAQIAGEKAGIIKPGVPVYVSPQLKRAREVIESVTVARHAPLHFVEPLKKHHSPLAGRHQQVNAAVSWGMVAQLADQLDYNEEKVAAGLADTCWPGRFEMMPGGEDLPPPLLVDCAHNVDSINILLRTLTQCHRWRPLTFIFGANRDKRMLPMLERLLLRSPRVVLVQSRHPKSLSVEAILEEVQPKIDTQSPQQTPLRIEVATSMQEAIRCAAAITPAGGLMVGTGSVFVVAELREAWNALHPGLFPAHDWVHEVSNEPPLNIAVAGKQV